MGRKLIQKLFDFMKSTIHFVKIVILFFVLILLLYWVQNLINSEWAWLSVFKPTLDFFIGIGKAVNDGSIDAFGAVFEYKYAIALVLVVSLYFVMNVVTKITEKINDICIDAYILSNKIQENHLNNTLEKEAVNEQKKLNKYEVYITTSIKKKFSHVELNINIDEQNVIMNKFLIEKLGIAPTKMNDGFLYKFNNFDKIDDVIEVLRKLVKSDAPLNYYISVQIFDGDASICTSKILQLDALKLENKICMNSDTAYRYKYNSAHRYGITQVGIFQKNNDTIEVSEFVEIL